MSNKEVIEKATKKIIEKMEAGKLNWNKPWNGGNLPQNYISKKAYRGWNMFITMFSEFESPYYLTFNQVKQLKGSIKKGSKGLPIIFWKKFSKETDELTESGEKKVKGYLIAKEFVIFNAEQIEGIDFKKPVLNDLGTVDELEQAINEMEKPVKIMHKNSDRAFYTPSKDEIVMPLKGQFKSTEEYYSTKIHEIVHSTGHSTRLNRESLTTLNVDNHNYSYEELVAELGSAYVLAMYGVANEKSENNSAAYLQGWLKSFKGDMQMLYKASIDASKAMEYITGKNKVVADEEE